MERFKNSIPLPLKINKKKTVIIFFFFYYIKLKKWVKFEERGHLILIFKFEWSYVVN